MSQARYKPIEPPEAHGGAAAIGNAPTDAMRTFCALRAQISPTRRVVVIPPAVSRSFLRVGRGTAIALRSVAKRIGRVGS